jgi:hypothetical protein
MVESFDICRISTSILLLYLNVAGTQSGLGCFGFFYAYRSVSVDISCSAKAQWTAVLSQSMPKARHAASTSGLGSKYVSLHRERPKVTAYLCDILFGEKTTRYS